MKFKVTIHSKSLLFVFLYSLLGSPLYAQLASTDDFDGDNVINSIDIDDDNDGILDVDEYKLTKYPVNAGVIIPGATAGTTYSGTTDISLDLGLPANTVSVTYTDIHSSSTNSSALNILNSESPHYSFTSSYPIQFEVRLGKNDWGNITPVERGFVSNDGMTYEFTTDLNTGYTEMNTPVSKFFVERDATASSGSATVIGSKIVWLSNFLSSDFEVTLFEEGIGNNYALPFYVPADTDGDGLPDYLDLDSDGDGIADIIEAGGVDANNDGIVDDFVDANGNGWSSVFDDGSADSLATEGGTPLADADMDSDTCANRLDIDSDNDGIVDIIEGQGTNSYVAPLGTDADSDGIDDAFDADYVGGGTVRGSLVGTPSNVDGDAEPDYLDLDSDEDGTTDQAESGILAAVSTADADFDGLYNDYDSDGTSDIDLGKSNNGGDTPATFTNTGGSAERDWREDATTQIIWDGTAWFNGSDSGEPNGDEFGDNGYTSIRVMSGSEATANNAVIIPNLIIDDGAVLNLSSCYTVTTNATNNGLMRLVAISDEEDNYGQYLGEALRNVECQMYFDNGWHNIGFPVQITASQWAEENNTVDDPDRVYLTNVEGEQNLRWYDSYTSGGKEQGFFVADDLVSGTTYSTHSYGQLNMVSDGSATFGSTPDQDLTAKGFNYYMDERFFNTSRVLSATGTTNASEKTYTTSNNFGGFNMIPNIYPVSLDANVIWNDVTYGFGNIEDGGSIPYFSEVIYMWDPTNAFETPLPGDYANGSYVAFDPATGNAIGSVPEVIGKDDHLIAPFQAFYIHRTDASTVRRIDEDGTNVYATSPAVAAGVTADPAVTHVGVDVTMSPNFRTACLSTKHFKTTNGPSVTDVILLNAYESDNSEIGDATEMAFANHYSQGYDLGYDIHKNSSGGAGAPTLFTILGDKALVINKQSYPENNHTIPVGFKGAKGKNGKQYTLAATQLPEGWTVYLEDKMTSAWHDLTEEDYVFTNNSGFQLERFAVHFNKYGAPISTVFEASTKAWSTQEGIEISFNNMKSQSTEIRVTNLSGQILFIDKKASTNENYVIPFDNLVEELYIVTVKSVGSFDTHKIVR